MATEGEPPAGGEDYEYDLAHEVAEVPAPAPEAAEPVRPSTATPAESAGDYSYDQAHDLP